MEDGLRVSLGVTCEVVLCLLGKSLRHLLPPLHAAFYLGTTGQEATLAMGEIRKRSSTVGGHRVSKGYTTCLGRLTTALICIYRSMLVYR